MRERGFQEVADHADKPTMPRSENWRWRNLISPAEIRQRPQSLLQRSDAITRQTWYPKRRPRLRWRGRISKTNPAEARRLVQPLVSSGGDDAPIAAQVLPKFRRNSPAPNAARTSGFASEASRGRRYPEPEHPYRNAFQRDRDRIIHARAFRRLENKTQVFSPGISDHFRNRLTHTLEVSQIARTVANVLELDEDLTEALSLGHDIGHPPFAHAGEEELDRQMRRFGERFDHNIQALRIVEELEQRYPRFPGLNLTFEVREGIVKHSRDFEPGEIPALDEYLPGLRPPLEAQLIDLADEIAYNAADLDDAFEAGMIDAAGIAAHVPAWAEILDAWKRNSRERRSANVFRNRCGN